MNRPIHRQTWDVNSAVNRLLWIRVLACYSQLQPCSFCFVILATEEADLEAA